MWNSFIYAILCLIMSFLINPQAEKLNSIIQKNNPPIIALLSQKGKAIYFPKDGILAQTAQAKGSKINATIGIALEDDGLPIRLSTIEKLIKLSPKEVFPYAPSFGKLELRTVWKNLIKKKNPSLKEKISLPVVTNALTHALSVIGYLFTNEGNEIITPDTFWGNYRLVFEKAYGAILSTFNTFSKNGFDIASFEKKLKSNKKEKIIILFNFPNNPSGYTPTEKEAKTLVEIVKKLALSGKKILTIIDDAYFGLVYQKGIITESLFSHLSSIHPNVLAVKIDGVTKEEYAWGLRVGFITYSSKNIKDETLLALEDKTAGVVRGSISNASHLSQSLILEGLKSPDYGGEKQQKYHLLKLRFETVNKALTNQKYRPYFTPLPFNSGYFMCLKLNDKLDAEKVRLALLEKYSTGIISMKNLLRIAYSSVATKDIPIVFENIYKVCRKESC